MSLPNDKLTDHQALALKIRDEDPTLGWTGLGHRMTEEVGVEISRSSARRALLGGEKKLRRLKTGGEALETRLERGWSAYVESIQDVTDDDLSNTARLQAMKTLWYLANNPEVWTRSSGKDLTSMFGTLVDKSQLLRGEPTSITRLEDVKKLDELGAMLEAEMRRRGKIIDITPEAV